MLQDAMLSAAALDWHMLGAQAVASVGSAHLQQFFKNTDLVKWLNDHTTTRNRLVALGAALAGAGISATLDGSWEAGGKFVLEFPPMPQVISSVLAGYTMSERYYAMMIKPKQKGNGEDAKAAVA